MEPDAGRIAPTDRRRGTPKRCSNSSLRASTLANVSLKFR